jgi:P-type conjugative transfer protein TrbJ
MRKRGVAGVVAHESARSRYLRKLQHDNDAAPRIWETASAGRNAASAIFDPASAIRKHVTNTTSVPQQIYSSAMSDMQSVQNLMTAGTQLSFSNPDSSMGTFSSFLNSSSGQLGNLSSQATQYQAWSQQSKDGITAAMNALSAQNSQLATDNNTMTQLQAQAAASNGQMQAMQNGAEISAQGVRETEKLRQLVMVQTQLQANQQAINSQQDAQSQAQWQAFVNVAPLPTTGTNY